MQVILSVASPFFHDPAPYHFEFNSDPDFNSDVHNYGATMGPMKLPAVPLKAGQGIQAKANKRFPSGDGRFRLDKNERSFYFVIMRKGQITKMQILETGVDMASQMGLEGVSIGALSKAMDMSKSGLYAHFQSKENLQIEILKYAGQMFAENVVIPALAEKAGIPRIKALVYNWNEWTSQITGGCIFVNASADFGERPGAVRDFILAQQEQWLDTLRRLARSAIRVGAFRQDIDCDQFAFELYSLLLGFHLYYKLLNDSDTKRRQEAALEQLLDNYRPPAF